MDEKVIAHLECLDKLKETIVDATKAEIAKGLDKVSTAELGEAVDMIKDLADAKKNCLEACYYEQVVHAMSEGEEYEGRRRMGYKPYMDQQPYIFRHMGSIDADNPNYERLVDYGDKQTWPKTHEPKSEGKEGMEDWDGRYSDSYSRYKHARRNYTMTHDKEDNAESKKYAKDFIMLTLNSIKEMWEEADSDLKKRIKMDLTNLVGELEI